MDTLKEMGSAQLSRVEDFVVGCVELGFVRWHGKTDVRGLNIDDIVIFEKKAVTVYPDRGIYPKPPVGEGLNKPATITLLHVFPKKPEHAEKYAQMIANATKKFDGRLLGYDPDKGTWEFEVEHFSRYGLSDEDEEPDIRDTSSATDLAGPSSLQPEHAETSTQAKFSAPKATVPSPDITTAPLQSALQLSVYAPPESKPSRSARLSGLSMRGLLFTEEPEPTHQPIVSHKLKSPISDTPPFSQAFIAKEHERTSRVKSFIAPHTSRHNIAPSQPTTTRNVQVPNPVSIFASVQQAEKEAELVVHVPELRLKMLALEESVVAKASSRIQSDVSLTMGRSFRVGWGPDGRLLRTSGTLGTMTISSPVLSTRTPSGSAASDISEGRMAVSDDTGPPSRFASINRYILELLQMHLLHSKAQYGPHFTLKDVHENIQSNIKICEPNPDGTPVGNSSDDSEYATRQHLYLVWTLVYSLWGKMPGSFPVEIAKQLPDLDDTDSTERSISIHLTRKLLVSKWLAQALQVPVENAVKAVKLSSGNNALAILHYLTGRQISPAVALAQRSRDYRLAVLLTQTWTSALQLLGIQLEHWELTNTLPFIDDQLLAVYKLLAGDVEYVGRNIQEIRNDWLRCFALHFWYKHVPSTSMPEVLGTYDAAVEQGSASSAIPPYLKHTAGAGERTVARDSLYRLLQIYSSTTHHQQTASEDVAPQGGPTITTTRFAPPTATLPTSLLLFAVDPANYTQDPMDFSLAWHLYTVLRIVPALSSVVDLPVPHRLHTSYAAQLEILGQWQWAIYVLLHINFDSYKTVNGEWGFASGRQSAVSAILERHAPSITEEYYLFLTHELKVPASWVDSAIGRYLVYSRQYKQGVQRLLRAGSWNEAHRVLIQYIVPFCFDPCADTGNSITEKEVINMLETLQSNFTHLVDPTWNVGGHIYLVYLKLKLKLAALDSESAESGSELESGSVIGTSKSRGGAVTELHFQELVNEMPNIYTLCKLVSQWSQIHMTATVHNSSPARIPPPITHTTPTNPIPPPTHIVMATIATHVGHWLLALARGPQHQHDSHPGIHAVHDLPSHLMALPLPPDHRQAILDHYFHDMVYAV